MQAVNIVECVAASVPEVEAVYIDGVLTGYLGRIKPTSESFKSHCLQVINLWHSGKLATHTIDCWGNGWEWYEKRSKQFPDVVVSGVSSWFTGKHLVSSFVGEVRGLKLQMSQEPKPPRDGFYYFPISE